MPRWLCADCGVEFWGWGVSYRYKSGSTLRCPDCGGELAEQKGDRVRGIVTRVVKDPDAA